MRLGLSLLMMMFNVAALAGVDQGNPKGRSIYNLQHGYRIVVGQPIKVDMKDPDAVKIDVVETYGRYGFFLLLNGTAERPPGGTICDQRPIEGRTLTLFWVGADCKHPYFLRAFENIYSSVQIVEFPEIKNKE